MAAGDDSHPTELVYLPRASVYPALIAAGIAGVLVSIFTWWPYGAVGALVALWALWAMIRESREEFARLPRRQRVTTAPVPAIPVRKRSE